MKRFLALLLLAGCGSQDEGGGRGGGQGGVPGGLDGLENQSAAQDPAALEARAAAALAGALPDPPSARFANIRGAPGNAICGDVDAKQADGKYTGFRPFVVSPEGVGVVSSTTTIMFNDPADLFPDFHIRYCASPEELQNLGGRVARGDPALTTPLGEEPQNSAGPAPDAPVAVPADPMPPMPGPKAEPRRQPAPKAAPAGSGEEDSFLKAVKRPEEGPAPTK